MTARVSLSVHVTPAIEQSEKLPVITCKLTLNVLNSLRTSTYVDHSNVSFVILQVIIISLKLRLILLYINKAPGITLFGVIYFCH